MPLVDAHVHVARLPTLSPAFVSWAREFGRGGPFESLYDEAGTIVPARLAAHLDHEGVDVVLLMSEYSPKATGIQPIEDLLPLVEHDAHRFRLVANLNPHLHHPMRAELERQLALGAVALKLHPVHGGFSPLERTLYPVYDRCEAEGVPVVFHSGTSIFPGSTNAWADPALVDQVASDFPGLTLVLAHGGRGWWYDAAAFLALSRDTVWIELSGLPPRRLPEYYARHDLRRLARRFIFGTDWPGVPGIRANADALADALADLGVDDDTVQAIRWRNANTVYHLNL